MRRIDRYDLYTLKTYSSKIIGIYKNISRKLSLIKGNLIFKTWIKKLMINPKSESKISTFADNIQVNNAPYLIDAECSEV